MVVIPCGREDGKNTGEEVPYEIKLKKKGNINIAPPTDSFYSIYIPLFMNLTTDYSEWEQPERDISEEASFLGKYI